MTHGLRKRSSPENIQTTSKQTLKRMTSDQGIIRGNYYPHIDGIRAFAILPVLLYHAFPTFFPGGFIGVDVFFVISGYLITRGLLTDLEAGKYSIGAFYIRRIRRIFPAYAAVIMFSLIAGGIIYYGEKLKILATTALSSSFFATNIYFERTSDYFSPGAHENELLNLWSLSVEEQFYVFFPLFLALLYKYTPQHIKTYIWLTAITSFLLSIWAVNCNSHDTLAFYWLPFRAWELMAGSLLAIHIKDNFINFSTGFLSLIVLIFTIFLISDTTPFPGLTATIPILCAVSLIENGQFGIAKKILEHNVIVFIGKISYSLYLFHWPILVFSRYTLSGYLPSVTINCIAIVLSIISSIFSWKYIELPLRHTKWHDSSYYKLGACIIAITLLSSLTIRQIAEYERQHSLVIIEKYWDGQAADKNKFPDPQWPECENRTPNSLTVLGGHENPQYVLWGDSHAMALSPGFNTFSLATGINGLYINRKHTLLSGTISRTYPDNAQWISQILEWLQKQPELKTIILANRWAVRSQGWANESGRKVIYSRLDGRGSSPEEIFELGITQLCSQLKEIGKQVIIITSIPEQGTNVPAKLQRFGLLSTSTGISEAEYAERQHEANIIFKRLQDDKLAQIIWVKPVFFPNGKILPLLLPGQISMYVDDNHLSPSGANYLLEQIRPTLQQAIQSHQTSP